MARRRISSQCPMDAILLQIMGPWTTYILWLLQNRGAMRFGAIRAQMPDISSKVLTDRLRQLEASRLVDRDYRPTIPPSVTYTLTPRAAELGGVLSGLCRIAEKWAAEDALAQETSEGGGERLIPGCAVPPPATTGDAPADRLPPRQAGVDRLSVPDSPKTSGEQR